MDKPCAWVVYGRDEAVQNKIFIRMLTEELLKHNISLVLLIEEDLSLAHSASAVTYAKTMPGKPLFVINRTRNYLLARHWEGMGLRVFNHSAVNELCNDKYKTYRHLLRAGVPVLRTELLSKDKACGLGFPLVIKPVDGKGGENVFLISCQRELASARDALRERTCIVQEAAGVTGQDVRVYVVGGKIAAAMRRVSNGDFRSNYRLGGGAAVYELSEREKALVNKVTDSADFDFVGIDFLFHNGGIVCNEIEDPVGSRMLYHCADIDIVPAVIGHIIRSLPQ